MIYYRMQNTLLYRHSILHALCNKSSIDHVIYYRANNTLFFRHSISLCTLLYICALIEICSIFACSIEKADLYRIENSFLESCIATNIHS